MAAPAPKPIASGPKLNPHTIRRIAVECGRDPRTVVAALQGRASPNATAAVMATIGRMGIALQADGLNLRATG